MIVAQRIVSRICQEYGISPEPSIRIMGPSTSAIPNAYVRFSHRNSVQATIRIDQRLFNKAYEDALDKSIAHEMAHYRHHDLGYIGLWDDICARLGGSKAKIKRNTNTIIYIIREIRADIEGAQYSIVERDTIIQEFNKLHKQWGVEKDTLTAQFCNHYPPFDVRGKFVGEHTFFTSKTLDDILELYAGYDFDKNSIYQLFVTNES